MQRYGQPYGQGGHPGGGGNPYGAPKSGPPAPKKDSTGRILIIVLSVVFGVMLLFGVIGYFAWKAFLKFGMNSDTDDYADVVRRSQLQPAVEKELLSRIDRIEDGIRRGDLSYSLFEWIPLDEEINDFTGDGVVTPDEVPGLVEALDEMEKTGR